MATKKAVKKAVKKVAKGNKFIFSDGGGYISDEYDTAAACHDEALEEGFDVFTVFQKVGKYQVKTSVTLEEIV